MAKEPIANHSKEDDSATALSVMSTAASETASESTSVIITAVDTHPSVSASSHTPKDQQLQSVVEPMTGDISEDKETDQEMMEQTALVEEHEVVDDGGDDNMAPVSESAATSEVIIDDDDDDAEVGADEPEEETMEAEEEEVEEEGNEEAEDNNDEDEEDVDIEGYEATTTEPNMETDVGLSKSDPIELSSDEETEQTPSVMLSSTVRLVFRVCVCVSVSVCVCVCLCA